MKIKLLLVLLLGLGFDLSADFDNKCSILLNKLKSKNSITEEMYN